jgi:nicotinamidase-related amidase
MLRLRVRNVSYPLTDPGGDSLQSEHYRLRSRCLDIPLENSALVLIDTWDTVVERQGDIRTATDRFVSEKVRPILQAARDADMLVLHAPHRPIGWDGINRAARGIDLRGPSETPRAELPESIDKRRLSKYQWPPIEFVYRVGEHAKYSRFSNPSYMQYADILGIHKELRPEKRPREFISSAPADVHKIFRQNRILHLFYVGGATNQCIVNRPVGIRRMSALGYNTIIVRGATRGSEFANTLDSSVVTNAAILDIEINNGFSTSDADFLRALREARHGPATTAHTAAAE